MATVVRQKEHIPIKQVSQTFTSSAIYEKAPPTPCVYSCQCGCAGDSVGLFYQDQARLISKNNTLR